MAVIKYSCHLTVAKEFIITGNLTGKVNTSQQPLTELGPELREWACQSCREDAIYIFICSCYAGNGQVVMSLRECRLDSK